MSGLTGDGPALELAQEWLILDAPLRRAPAHEWVACWRAFGGFVVGGDVVESARPVRPLRLFRASWSRVGGMSWTPFRTEAWSYAVAIHDRAPIWRATIEPAAMLAALPGAWGGAWSEIVVDPSGIVGELCAKSGERVPLSTRADDLIALNAALPIAP